MVYKCVYFVLVSIEIVMYVFILFIEVAILD